MKKVLFIIYLLIIGVTSMYTQINDRQPRQYNALVDLFKDWREFEEPPRLNGAPDYTANRFDRDQKSFKELEERLNRIKIDDWPVPYQVDWHIVRAEMNGYDFNYRILQPWVRDPAYYQTIWDYQSDVPAHEGPTNHATLELWTYQFPLSTGEVKRLTSDLNVIPPLLVQAQKNLIGNAKDLWVAGIENIRNQTLSLNKLAKMIQDSKTHSELVTALENAKNATEDFIIWLEEQAPTKTGPSGIGKDNYTWYQQNVHLVPLTWEEEVQLLQRELDRAWTSLKLEEQRNKDLPPMVAANTSEEFTQLTEKGVQRFMGFLREKEIMHIKPNMEPALREHMGEFVPEDQRNFFVIGMHYDPVPLYSHFYPLDPWIRNFHDAHLHNRIICTCFRITLGD